MLRILDDKKTIYITQGDTLDTLVSPLIENDYGELVDYTPEVGDMIRFAVAGAFGQEPIIVQSIPTDTLHLRVEADDTKKLIARKKPYVYDIELTKADGTVITFIDRGELYSTDEVL